MMTLDTSIQFFMNNVWCVTWRELKKRPGVYYYYAEDRCYLFKHNGMFVFAKGICPSDAWRSFFEKKGVK